MIYQDFGAGPLEYNEHFGLLRKISNHLDSQGGNDGLGVDQAGVTQVVQACRTDMIDVKCNMAQLTHRS